jgi:hemerythrin superfamily protein
MDAIVRLKKDHAEVKRLFRAFEVGHKKHMRSGADGLPDKLEEIVMRLVRELSMHAAIEEEVIYPLALNRVKPLGGKVLLALEEHHLVKVALNELMRAPRDERFAMKVKVIAENVLNHIQEEETVLFPRMRKALSRKELLRIGDMIVRLKRSVPTRPHPRAPDRPPANLLANAGAAVLDRTRDALRELMT